MNLVGIIQWFVKNKRKSYVTNIYGMLYLMTCGACFLVGCIVIPDNCASFFQGKLPEDFDYGAIV